jgi:hypothetical protein
VPRVLSPADTARFVREQVENYERLGKAVGIVLNP